MILTFLRGGFSNVIKSCEGVSELGTLITSANIPGILVPFLIGAGTMIGSHVSDSGFWIRTSLFNLNTKQGTYKQRDNR